MSKIQELEFKEALSQLPDKEKDKLILKLLKKDYILSERLYFELLEPYTLESRRNSIKENQLKYLKRYQDGATHTIYLYGFLRDLSGLINEHVAITKDKYGEIELNLWITINCLELYKNLISNEPLERSYKFTAAVIARIFKILQLISKLHPDLAVDFRSDLNTLSDLIKDIPKLVDAARKHKLNLEWLEEFEIPSDIADISKRLRSQGLLK